MPEIRVLQNNARSMQRLGYLKRLVRRVTSLSTSNLDNLGNDLIEAATRKIRVPLDSARATYIKQRLYDRTYNSLKAQTDTWIKNEQRGEPPVVLMELQDLYLADRSLPSQVGKLVKKDQRRYPLLGISLGFIRAGTYSPNTRAYSLLHLTSNAELQAFLDYKPETNPLRLSRPQALLLLYSLLENDGEVVAPLWAGLAQEPSAKFTDRDLGNKLPTIYRSIVARHRSRMISADERERLLVLEQSAETISLRRDASYSGGAGREEGSRPRVEPYADIGWLTKPDPYKYEYTLAADGLVWARAMESVQTSEEVDVFLSSQFFTTAARAWAPQAQAISDPEQIIPYLYRAWEAIRGTGGYAPIEELALIAGIEALLEQQLIIEPTRAHDAIVAYQKANPYQVRFTVNRLGVLAHARFLEAPSDTLSIERR